MKQRCVIDKKMGIIRTQVKLLSFLIYLIGSIHHVTSKFNIPSDRIATSLDDSEHTLDNADEKLEKNGNMFKDWNTPRAKKHEPSTPPMKLPNILSFNNEHSTPPLKIPKIFSWKSTGSISFARSLSKSLLDLFEYYFGDVPGLGAPFILWDFFCREVVQGT